MQQATFHVLAACDQDLRSSTPSKVGRMVLNPPQLTTPGGLRTIRPTHRGCVTDTFVRTRFALPV
jgi:hypothetical protein